jgi:very-long-chain (3R)-3-hydroxyacyl-CoA dehydratase
VGAWAAVEVPRYLFYTCELLLGKGTSPYALAWLRYSLFVVLYPLGIAGEVGCLYFSLPAADQLVWAPGPGNALNVAYNHGLVLRLLVALYPPGSYTMVAHMWVARAKWLRAGAEKDK